VNPSPVEYREDLDAGLVKIAGICLLAAVMASLDTTVVSVAQRTFITEFHTSQAVVAWTMTGNTLALATVIPLTGWAANRFGRPPTAVRLQRCAGRGPPSAQPPRLLRLCTPCVSAAKRQSGSARPA
jgi:MFS family permease